MIVGIPKEIKNSENRVSMTPSGIRELTRKGHGVLVERAAGMGAGYADEEYKSAGAHIKATAQEVWKAADMIVKVKEPIEIEYGHFREDLIIFTYLHLAADKPLTEKLLEKRVTAIAYETVELSDGALPLLKPMSEIAGKIAAQEAANILAKHRGGKGILMGGVAGVFPAKVVILGGGISGTNAARVCLGMGAHVTILDISLERLTCLEENLDGRCFTALSNRENIKKSIGSSDIVIGCVLVPGAKSPHLITRSMLQDLEQGTVLVDIAIDQGGCFETSRPTTHEDPTFVIDEVIHYCVANMPGAMPRTSTQALSNATLPYIVELAGSGFDKIINSNPALSKGVNTFKGFLGNEKVADALGMGHKLFDQINGKTKSIN